MRRYATLFDSVDLQLITAMKSTIAILVIAIAVGSAVLVAVPYRAVFETGHPSQLLWHDDEAFAFLVTGQSGREGSLAYHLLSMVSAFGAPSQNRQQRTTVFRITSDSLEETHLDGAVPSLLIADGQVSSGSARWVDGRFEPFDPRHIPEAFLMTGLVRPSKGVTLKDVIARDSFSDVEGWSKQTFMITRTDPLQKTGFTLSKDAAHLVVSQDGDSTVVDLARQGQPTKRLIAIRTLPRRVSSEEYNALFNR